MVRLPVTMRMPAPVLGPSERSPWTTLITGVALVPRFVMDGLVPYMLAGFAEAVIWLTRLVKPSTVAKGPSTALTFDTAGVAVAPDVYFAGRGISATNVVTAALLKPPTAGWLTGTPQPTPAFGPWATSVPSTPNAFELGAP